MTFKELKAWATWNIYSILATISVIIIVSIGFSMIEYKEIGAPKKERVYMEIINSNKMSTHDYRIIDLDEENLQIYILRDTEDYKVVLYRMSDDCPLAKAVIKADLLKD